MVANQPMVELWNGVDTAAWTTHPERYDTMLAPFGDAVLDAARPTPGEKVLDVGCGAGTLTLAAARAVGPTGTATGVDISRPLLDLAAQRADQSGSTTAAFEEADAQTAPLEPDIYDVIVSRFGVMFFDDPVAAFSNLRRAARPGGRLAFVCWQALGENEWAMVPVLAALPHVGVPEAPAPGAPGPFAFGDRDRILETLSPAGWADVRIEELRTSIHVGGAADPDEAVAYYRDDVFGKVLFGRGDEAAQTAALEELRSALSERATEAGVFLGAATWIVTAAADGGA